MKKILLLALIALAINSSAQVPTLLLNDETGWHRIAVKNIELKNDRDEFSLLGSNRFSTLKLLVKDVPIHIYRMEVFYKNGDIQVMKVRKLILPGSETENFDLKGKENDVEKIILLYKTAANSAEKEAQVEIWGKKTNEVPTISKFEMPGIVLCNKKGWHKIAERTINWKMDHDEIKVIGADRFSSVKFIAVFASIDFRSIEVFFEDGTTQKISVENPLKIGRESAEIQLNGGERKLKKIVFEYKTVPDQKLEKALVEVWGFKNK